MSPERIVFKRLYNLILAKYTSVKNFSKSVFYNQTTVVRKLRGEAMFTTGDIKPGVRFYTLPSRRLHTSSLKIMRG